jgi:hypothetical protein
MAILGKAMGLRGGTVGLPAEERHSYGGCPSGPLPITDSTNPYIPRGEENTSFGTAYLYQTKELIETP